MIHSPKQPWNREEGEKVVGKFRNEGFSFLWKVKSMDSRARLLCLDAGFAIC